ncbi:MAG: hypothetical protein KBF66_14135 [Rhodoferax sp.]|uniref:SHOCT domain-containing protein n=1 Tax=Rhodoferax sp. TaxID=50421 RepID=UPI001B74B014|nr:SHOCT domain-containing protein [Rhodoferax sp.]MBP9906696.1 hypothetical protein [Rhodoferax sp.]
MKKLIVCCAALVFGTLVTSGCSSSRSNVTVHESTSISKGQELTDLQRALNEGAITEREYESVRKVLLNRPY